MYNRSQVITAIVVFMLILSERAFAQEQEGAESEDPRLARFEQAWSTYTTIRKAFGDEHVIIAPNVFIASPIANRFNNGKRSGGISIMTTVPLLGFGGGYGCDWWPETGTKDATVIYRHLLRVTKDYLEAFDGATEVSELRKAVKAIRKIARLHIDLDSFAWESAEDLLGKAKDFLASSDPADTLKTKLASAICKFTQDLGGTECNAEDLTAAIQAFKKVLETGAEASPDSADEKIPTRRHTLLVGPTVGIPLTKDPRELYFYGGALEWGPHTAFRLNLSSGLVGAYEDGSFKEAASQGWFFAVGISGEFGDDLVHLFNGGTRVLANTAQQSQIE